MEDLRQAVAKEAARAATAEGAAASQAAEIMRLNAALRGEDQGQGKPQDTQRKK